MSKPKDVRALIDLTHTTQALLKHYQSSLAPSKTTPKTNSSATTEYANPLGVIKDSTTLLKSHTTTLSLLLITPPLTPSALISKLGDVTSGPLSSMVAAASYVPAKGQRGDVGNIMRAEVQAQVRRLLGTWSDVLALVLNMAEAREKKIGSDKDKEKQDVLSATGVLWDSCDALLKLCADGIVGLVVKKAQELRAVLLDAVEELKEWGEDVADDDDDEAEGSDEDEDEIFAPQNKLGKNDEQLKAALDVATKKIKMIGMLYQALIKRRLKTYPVSSITEPVITATEDQGKRTSSSVKLDGLMGVLKSIPEAVDDIAGAFYDLDEKEVEKTMERCCSEAKSAVRIVEKNWIGDEDEFTTWLRNWVEALDKV